MSWPSRMRWIGVWMVAASLLAAACSSSTDSASTERAGIPSLTFGPSRGKAAVQGTGFVELDAFVDGAKIYALTALGLCADLRP